MHPEHIGLIANTGKPGAHEMVANLQREFGRYPVRLLYERETAILAGAEGSLELPALAEACDLLLVLGGDGTLLQVVQMLEGEFPPIYGINIGSLGFLTCVAGNNYAEAVEVIAHGRYQISQRTLLTVEVLHDDEVIGSYRALNDAVVSRGELSRLIRLAVRIGDDTLTEYNCDGLIVATPTGSTAYSLSAGGPVLTPDCGVVVVTPICPHVLTNRSVIVADGATIEILPSRTQGPVFLTIDGGNVLRVESSDTVRISKAPFRLPLAMPPGVSFFDVLRQKLRWSGTAI
jgi:NAD+ kinase